MKCPFCQTDNREDRDTCYYCSKDISMLRLLVNKARHHYNTGLEHAERGRLKDAAAELVNALDLDSTFSPARVVLGTVYAKMEDTEKARETWRGAVCQDIHLEKAYEYLTKVDAVIEERPVRKWLFRTMGLCAVLAVIVVGLLADRLVTPESWRDLEAASTAIRERDYALADALLAPLATLNGGDGHVAKAASSMTHILQILLQNHTNWIRQQIVRKEFALARQQIDELGRFKLPVSAHQEVASLELHLHAQMAAELDEIADETQLAASAADIDRLQGRLERIEKSLGDNGELAPRVADARKELRRMRDSLPVIPTPEQYEVQQTHLLDYAGAIERGDWREAEGHLLLLLNAVPEVRRQTVAHLAQAFAAGRLATAPSPEFPAQLAQGVRARYPGLAFDLGAGGEGGSTGAMSAAAMGGSDPWYAQWFAQHEETLASGAGGESVVRLARLNLVELRGSLGTYYAGIVALAEGDEEAAADMAARLAADDGGDADLARRLSEHLERRG